MWTFALVAVAAPLPADPPEPAAVATPPLAPERARAVLAELRRNGLYAKAEALDRRAGGLGLAVVDGSDATGAWIAREESEASRTLPLVTPDPRGAGVLVTASVEAFGLSDAGTWWLLPAEGPPSEAVFARHERQLGNPVDLETRVDHVAGAPAGAPLLVAVQGTMPPPVWWADAGAERRPDPARAEARASCWAAEALGVVARHSDTWPAGEARGVRVYWDSGARRETDSGPAVVEAFADVHVAPDGTVTEIRRGENAREVALPRMERDVDGDGLLDIWWTGCGEQERLQSGAGPVLTGVFRHCC